MNARRSERLRRKRQTTPGLSQPGAYSLHNNAYVVESEASYLPTTPNDEKRAANAALESRRNRYINSPHRYPAGITSDDSPLPIRKSSNQNQKSNITQPQVRQRQSIADQVKTSIFDILGSAARKPVKGKWTATPAFGYLRRNSSPRKENEDGDDDDVIQTDEEEEDMRQDQLQRQLVTDLDEEQISDQENDDIIPPITPNLGLRNRRTNTIPTRRNANVRPGMNQVPKNQRQLAMTSLIILLLLTGPVILILDSYTSPRASTTSLWKSISEPSLSTGSIVPVAQITWLFSGITNRINNVWRYLTRSAFSETRQERVLAELKEILVSTEGKVDVGSFITRDELSDDVIPKVIAEARRAAIEEANNRIKKESAGWKTKQKEKNGDDGFKRFAERFAADKGLPADYALGSAGAKVISSNPSDITIFARFLKRYVESLFSENIQNSHGGSPKSVKTVIDPNVLPGNCWAFDGEKGSVTIRLARPIDIESISFEHTPKSSVFNVLSAPRRVKVTGYRLIEKEKMDDGDSIGDVTNENNDVVDLGEYIFDLSNENSSHIQNFEVMKEKGDKKKETIRAIRFDILSNHGASYTTVYRLRVHGQEAKVSK